MLRASDLRAGYGTAAVLHGVNLALEAGERVAILGRNGVGKTSLMRAIIGQHPLSFGDIRFGSELFTTKNVHDRARAGCGAPHS